MLNKSHVREITLPPKRAPISEVYTPATGGRALRAMADAFERQEHQIKMLQNEVVKLLASIASKKAREVPNGRSSVNKGKVISVAMLEAIERVAARKARELELAKEQKQRRITTVANSNVIIKDRKQRLTASKKEVTRLKKDYHRNKLVLEQLQKDANKAVNKPRSQAS